MKNDIEMNLLEYNIEPNLIEEIGKDVERTFSNNEYTSEKAKVLYNTFSNSFWTLSFLCNCIIVDVPINFIHLVKFFFLISLEI